MNDLKNVANEAKQFATKIIIDYPDRLVYNDIKFAKRMSQYAEKIATHADFTKEKNYWVK